MPTSFERGLQVLLAVADRGRVPAAYLVERLDMPQSTVYRYLRSLRDFGVLTEDSGIYALSERFTGAAGGIPFDSLARVANPVLAGLARVSGETALVTVRVGTCAVCIAQVESAHPVRMRFDLGQVLPLAAGAGSRVLLAHAPADVIDTVLAEQLVQYTPATPNEDRLRRQLEGIRALGYATSRAEFVPGAHAVSVPVFRDGEVVAGLTVAGPANRCTHAWQMRARPLLTEAGRTLGALLG